MVLSEIPMTVCNILDSKTQLEGQEHDNIKVGIESLSSFQDDDS